MKKHKLLVISLVVGTGVCLWYLLKVRSEIDVATLHDNDVVAVEVGGRRFETELAVSDAKKTLGLTLYDDTDFSTNEAMLFLFDHPSTYAFWMKDMKFPIDIIWLKDNTVVDIDSDVPVPKEAGEPPRYHPSVPINRVLEVRAGEAANIHVNDSINITKL